MDYILETNYDFYLLDQLREQQNAERYIKECLILSEGVDVVNRIKVLNEGIGDKASETWEKIKAFLTKVWNKFIENFTRFFSADKGYCEKYKDIILKKPLKDELSPIEMRDCHVGIQRIINHKLPMFAPNLLSDISTAEGDTNLTFKKKLISDYDGKDEFVDFAKTYFIGSKEDKTVELHAINMTDIYNVITTYDKMKANIQADYNGLMKAVSAIESNLKKEIAPSTEQKKEEPAKEGEKVETSGGKVNESFFFNKPSAYSMVYERYVNEISVGNKSGGSTSSGSSPAPSNNMNNDTKGNIDKAHDTSVQGERKTQLANEDNKSLEQKSRLYLQFGQNFLTAKMTALDFIKKEYMTLVVAHVKSYMGDKDTKDGSAKSATEFKNKVQPVPEDKANEIKVIISKVEATKDEKAKEILKREVVADVRKATNDTFTGDYEAAKAHVGYKA